MKSKLGIVLVLAAFAGLIAANLARTTFSVQKRTTFAAVTSSALVASALGSPVEIGWPRGKGFERFSTRDDRDVITMRYPVRGPNGEAELSAGIQNVGGQGWVGEYRVEPVSTQTLVDGQYVSAPTRIRGVGSYDLDGSAQAMRPPQ